jgi:hypothetical protein
MASSHRSVYRSVDGWAGRSLDADQLAVKIARWFVVLTGSMLSKTLFLTDEPKS